MPIKVTIGFGAAFASWTLDMLLEVLQMRGIALSPTILEVATYVLLFLLLFGLLMMGWGLLQWVKQTRKQKQIIAKQSDDITDSEHSLEALRREYNASYLIDIPNMLTEIHQHLQTTVKQVVEEKPSDVVSYDVMQSWAAKIGVWIWYKPKKDKINKYLLSLQIVMLRPQLRKILSLSNDKMMVSLHTLAGELDGKGIGLASRLNDTYSLKLAELDKMLEGLGSLEVNKVIQRFLLYTYGLNSLLLFTRYTYYNPDYSKYQRWLPATFRTSESSLIQSINIHITNLRTEVVKQIQLYLIGKG